MKENKLAAILYFVCAMLWGASAGICALSSNIAMCSVNIGLSATFLCLGMLYRHRTKDDSHNSTNK